MKSVTFKKMLREKNLDFENVTSKMSEKVKRFMLNLVREHVSELKKTSSEMHTHYTDNL